MQGGRKFRVRTHYCFSGVLCPVTRHMSNGEPITSVIVGIDGGFNPSCFMRFYKGDGALMCQAGDVEKLRTFVQEARKSHQGLYISMKNTVYLVQVNINMRTSRCQSITVYVPTYTMGDEIACKQVTCMFQPEYIQALGESLTPIALQFL